MVLGQVAGEVPCQIWPLHVGDRIFIRGGCVKLRFTQVHRVNRAPSEPYASPIELMPGYSAIATRIPFQ